MKTIKWLNSKFIASMVLLIALENLVVGCGGGGGSGGSNASDTTNTPAGSKAPGTNSVSSNQFSTELTYSIDYNGPAGVISSNSQRIIRMLVSNNTDADSNPLTLDGSYQI